MCVGKYGLLARFAVVVAVIAIVDVSSTDEASAQNLFNYLFGSPVTPAARPAPLAQFPPPPPSGTRRASTSDATVHDPLSRSSRSQPTSLEETFEPQLRGRANVLDDGGSASYTTLCVRLCDGYYWPLHHASRRRDFQRAARSCEASCGEEARLFFMPNRGIGGIETAVDLQGRPYSKLPTALFYRKTLINGCACKPSPWSSAEVSRHNDYAAAEREAAMAVQAALATETSAPMGSFRATQEIGRPQLPARLAAARRRDRDVNGDTIVLANPDTTADLAVEDAEPTPPPKRSRPARVAKVEPAPERPRPPQRAEPKPRAAAPPAATFKPFAGAGGSQFKWPGD